MLHSRKVRMLYLVLSRRVLQLPASEANDDTASFNKHSPGVDPELFRRIDLCAFAEWALDLRRI